MKKLGLFAVRYRTSLGLDELILRLERERTRPDVRLQGRIDEHGFRLYRYGGLSARSYLLECRGEFLALENGTEAFVRFIPRPFETVILVAVLAVGARFALESTLRPVGLVILVGMAALYGVLAYAEWRAMRRALERTFDRRP